MTRSKRLKFIGFLGFLGFGGFQYFQNHNIGALGNFAFFGFFAYYWVGNIAGDMVDERYLENSRRAKVFTYYIALFEFAILYLIAPFEFITKEILTAVLALCFASLLIIYAITFYYNEKE